MRFQLESRHSKAELHAIKLSEDELVRVVQNHTGFPWFNGKAFIDNKGWYALSVHARAACDDLDMLIEILRAEKDYETSDRLRQIRNRLRSAVDYVHGTGGK